MMKEGFEIKPCCLPGMAANVLFVIGLVGSDIGYYRFAIMLNSGAVSVVAADNTVTAQDCWLNTYYQIVNTFVLWRPKEV